MAYHKSVHPEVSLLDLDYICRSRTGFESFAALLNAEGGYFPSIDCRDPQMEVLADCYDVAQIEFGDSRRAFRYGK